MTEFMDLIEKRQSVRNYSDKDIEKEKLIKCIEAARLAPSACNAQPWHFHLVIDKEKVEKVSEYVQDKVMNKFASKSKAFVIVTEERGKVISRFGGAIKNQDYRSVDIGIATEHICLEAAEMGIGTCIMGWFNEKKIKNLLNIPFSKRVRLVISFGYDNKGILRKKIRKPLEEILDII
ncbi:nitroreductase family protein [Clostridium sp. BJN0001]|uniref:nitroreductase family protein n=1 Tax=Clostridium sp. BJN0001 TaxID=2930219 RepID=UPI001FD0BE90|nr:nitroreductase family protein [Clostridium sp. BJN0001]